MLPGNHVVMVTVANGLGNMSAALNVSVLYPVAIRRITVDPVTLGQPFVLKAVVVGDLDFTVTVDYGDGNVVNSSTAMPHTSIVFHPLNDSVHHGSAPVYLLQLQHLYVAPGEYLISLSVTNKVSRVTNSLTANVADRDFSVTLTADRRSPVASNTFVSFSASTMTKDAVIFSWMCEACIERPVVHRLVLGFAGFRRIVSPIVSY